MTVRIQVVSQVQKQFVGCRASRWAELGNTRSIRERDLKDTGAEVCVSGLETIRAMGLQVDVFFTHWNIY